MTLNITLNMAGKQIHIVISFIPMSLTKNQHLKQMVPWAAAQWKESKDYDESRSLKLITDCRCISW